MTIWIDNETLKRVNIHAPYKGRSKLDTEAIRAELGVVEIAEPTPPADYSDETYYRTEQDDAPYVIYTKKSDEQINAAFNSKVWAQIASIESQTGLCRQLREFMLEQPGAQAKGWHKKVKDTDDQIAALKATLK